MPLVRIDQLQQFAAVNLLSDPGAVGGPVVIPFAVQVVLNWSIAGGKTGHNVLYGRSTGVPAPTVAQAQSIFSALTTGGLWTSFATHLANVVSLTGVTLTSVHSAGQPSFVSTGAGVAGTNAAVAMPSEMAVCVTLRTALRGASNRGRMYIPGYAVDQVIAGNLISATCVTDTAAWANNIRTVLSAQSYTWAIGQRERVAYIGNTGTAHPARAANCSVDVTSAIVRDNRWDSQRRRGLR